MIINLLGYYVVWWGIVYFDKTNNQSAIFLIFLLNLIVHFFINVKKYKNEIIVISLVTIIGLLSDLVLNHFRVFKLSEHYYFWLPIIWISFATTLLHSLKKILAQNKWIVFLLGGIAGPLSYYSAGKFQLLNYTHSILLIGIHVFAWGLLILVFKRFSSIFSSK